MLFHNTEQRCLFQHLRYAKAIAIKERWPPLELGPGLSARHDSANITAYCIALRTGRFGSSCSSSLPDH